MVVIIFNGREIGIGHQTSIRDMNGCDIGMTEVPDIVVSTLLILH